MKISRNVVAAYLAAVGFAIGIIGGMHGAASEPTVVHDAYVITRLHEQGGERTWATFEQLHTEAEGQQRYQQLIAEGHHTVRLERHVITVVAGPAK